MSLEQAADPFLPAWCELLGDADPYDQDFTWKKMHFALSLTEEVFAQLSLSQKEAVHAKLVSTMNQGVPMTPNLLKRAMEDKKKARATLETLGLALNGPADASHVGGHTVIGGQKVEMHVQGTAEWLRQ